MECLPRQNYGYYTGHAIGGASPNYGPTGPYQVPQTTSPNYGPGPYQVPQPTFQQTTEATATIYRICVGIV
jgi:hypothetical protein